MVHTCDLKLINFSTASAIMWACLCALIFLTWKDDGKCLAAQVSSSFWMLKVYIFYTLTHPSDFLLNSIFLMHRSDLILVRIFFKTFFSCYSETSQSNQQILERKEFQHFRHMGPSFCLAQWFKWGETQRQWPCLGSVVYCCFRRGEF